MTNSINQDARRSDPVSLGDAGGTNLRSSIVEMLIRMLAACIPIDMIDRAGDRIRIAKLRRRLGFCGSHVAMSQGLLVERPELLSIGNNVSFGPHISIMGAGGVVINTGAMLATRTLILTTQHDPAARVMRVTAAHAKVEIGEYAWIGAGAIILPGVKIGAQAVVGAGAVVTTDIPPYALAVGVPARVVRDRRGSGLDQGVVCDESS